MNSITLEIPDKSVPTLLEAIHHKDNANRLIDLGISWIIIDNPTPSITHLKCMMTSYNLNDVQNKYCGHCHVFWGDKDERKQTKEAKKG